MAYVYEDPSYHTMKQPANSASGWDDIAGAYGLGAPPAIGMPASLPGVQLGPPPMLPTDMSAFDNYMNQIYGQIGGAYDFNTPFAETNLLDPSQVPNVNAQQMGESDELKRLLSGEGYSPEILARMKASAIENPAIAGLQQMGQMKRALGEAGNFGGSAAALRGEVARETGRQQGENLNRVEVGNADLANKNFLSGVGFQTQIGMSNMEMANQMALQNANRMFAALQANQNASNAMNQFNTGNKFNQQMSKANAGAGFLGQQGAQGQQYRQQNEFENANKNFQTQQMNAGYDWERQKAQWDELNKRYSQAQGTMGGWGSY